MNKQKDPAVLFYISDWLTSTAEMDADCKGWYLNLTLHNYDKGSLPNDLEKLALLAGVKFSEYNRFEHVFKHVLQQKFDQTNDGRLSNRKTDKILRNREDFREKRSEAGKVSYVMRYFAKNYTNEYNNDEVKYFVKENFDYSIDLKNEQVIEHMFKHMFELYRNESRIKSVDSNLEVKKDAKFKNEDTFQIWWDAYGKKRDIKKCRAKWKKYPIEKQREIMKHTMAYVAATPDVQFRKNPLTYLNGENWMDEHMPPPRQATKKDSIDDVFARLRAPIEEKNLIDPMKNQTKYLT